jgi:hypothetical protein
LGIRRRACLQQLQDLNQAILLDPNTDEEVSYHTVVFAEVLRSPPASVVPLGVG